LERGDDQPRAAAGASGGILGQDADPFPGDAAEPQPGTVYRARRRSRSSGDKRFANPLWQTHPYFNFVKHQYLLGAKAIEDAVAELEGLDETDKARVEFFAGQIIDLFSPTNYLATNPDALERAVETEGMSLVQGLENLVRDIESHTGELLPTLADPRPSRSAATSPPPRARSSSATG
jgi:hypothetical protein